MTPFLEAALASLKENYHKGLVGSADAADLLGMNPHTLKTRVKRKQAMALREQDGSAHSPLVFTGFMLIYNLLSDRLMKWGVLAEEMERTLYTYAAEWTPEKILSGPQYINTVIRFRRDEDGSLIGDCFESGQVSYSPETCLIVPLGDMVARLAATLYMRSGKTDALRHAGVI